jgi:hypothetical protein
MPGPGREERFFGRRGFNQHVGKYSLFSHYAAASRSLRMTGKERLPNLETFIRKNPESAHMTDIGLPGMKDNKVFLIQI